jgi:hypothetical protein
VKAAREQPACPIHDIAGAAKSLADLLEFEA